MYDECRDERRRTEPAVVTVLEPKLRGEVDLAAHGVFDLVHTSSVADAMQAVRDRTVRAVLLSPHAFDEKQLPHVNRLLDGLPGVATVAVVEERAAVSPDRILALGACGVRRLVDLREKRGWSDLRASLDTDCGEVAMEISTRISGELISASQGTKEFFTMLVRHASETTSVKALATKVGIEPSTFVSRFFRQGLPSARRYLNGIRLVYASAHLRNSALSIASVARGLNYSSPQSFGRHIYLRYRVPAGTFRRTFPFDRMASEYVSDLVRPYLAKFEDFSPFG